MDMMLQSRGGSESMLRVTLQLELAVTHLAGVRQEPGRTSCSPTVGLLFWLLWVLSQHCCSMTTHMSFYCGESTSCRWHVWKWMKLMRVPAPPHGSQLALASPTSQPPSPQLPTLLTSGPMPGADGTHSQSVAPAPTSAQGQNLRINPLFYITDVLFL